MGILRRSSNHRVYKLWDDVEQDATVPEAARLASTSAARALYLVGIVGGAFAFALGSMAGGRLIHAMHMTPETKLGALLTFAPAIIAAVGMWNGMRALQMRVLRVALNKRTTIGATSSSNPSSSAGA
jgi:hypothetical protein